MELWRTLKSEKWPGITYAVQYVRIQSKFCVEIIAGQIKGTSHNGASSPIVIPLRETVLAKCHVLVPCVCGHGKRNCKPETAETLATNEPAAFTQCQRPGGFTPVSSQAQ